MNLEQIIEESKKPYWIPSNWQLKRSKALDDKFKPFNKSFDEMITQTKDFDSNERQYHTKRWYSTITSKGDELLVSSFPDCKLHDNPYDKKIDVWIGEIPVDIKSTNIPENFLNGLTLEEKIKYLQTEIAIRERFYQHMHKYQFNDRREEQHRLYIIHADSPEKEWLLRRDWSQKAKLIENFLDEPNWQDIEICDSIVKCGMVMITA